MSGHLVSDDDEARDCGLSVISAGEMRRRLQSQAARELNRDGHVARLYRKARQARLDGVDLDQIQSI